jgi:5'-3' exonuclease
MVVKFSNMMPNDSNTIIVDALNLAYRFLHQRKTDFAEDLCNTILSLANSYKATNIIVACDFGSSKYRLSLYPGYKSARKEKFETQTQEEKEKFTIFFEEFEKSLELMVEYFTLFRFKGVEADDIAAYLVKYKNDFNLGNIWLISSDKDWDLLIQDNVSRFSYVTRKEITVDNWHEHYSVPIEEYISLKVLTGDSGDSIPGVEGVGPVRAASLISEYGGALDIANALPLAGKAKYIKNLNISEDLIYLNYQLMDLLTYCEEAIGRDNIEVINNAIKL